MISDASLWIDIEIESWSYLPDSVVEPISGGYALNGGHIDTDITLADNQITNQYGIIFTVANFSHVSTREDYCKLTFYDEGDNLVDAGLAYMPISENGKVWTEIKVQHQVYKIEIDFAGNFDVTGIQIYGVANGSIGDATYTEKGKVVVDKTAGMVVADGKIGVNVGDGIVVTEDGKLSTTSDLSGSNWQALDVYNDGFIVNGTLADGTVSGGYNFKWQTDGNLLYENANRVIRCSYNNSAKPDYVAPTQESGESDDN